MSWRIDSTAGAAVWDTEPMGPEDLLCRDEELAWLTEHERGNWGLINGRIRRSGHPTSYGTFVSTSALGPPATLANVASLNGEASMWTTSLYTPWAANSLVGPSGWFVHVTYQVITSTSPASLTINPRIGSVASGSSSTGAVALGAGASNALTASITTNWTSWGYVTVQQAGIPGANAKAIADFYTIAKAGSAGNGAPTVTDMEGFTQASFDSTLSSGLVWGMANTVTTINYSVMQINWLSLF